MIIRDGETLMTTDGAAPGRGLWAYEGLEKGHEREEAFKLFRAAAARFLDAQLLEHTNADDELVRLEIVSQWMHQPEAMAVKKFPIT